MTRRVLILSCLFAVACYGGAQSSCFGASGPTPVPAPSPTPTPIPVVTVTPTPNPCDVRSVNVSGSPNVKTGELLRIDITPVGVNGPQEGALDYCNVSRTVKPENVANLTCAGSCAGFVQFWRAGAPGRFSIQFMVENVRSAVFDGEVTK